MIANLRDRSRINRFAGLLLALIVSIGAWLRLYNLGHESFWLDEAATWVVVKQEQVGTILNSVHDVGHAPVGFLIMAAANRLTGPSEASLRFPEALAGILSIAATYLVGRRLFGYWEALIGAGLLAVTATPLFYSQEARPYSWVLLFSLLATYYWLGCALSIKQGNIPRRRDSLAYLVFALLCIYTHYVVALMLVWQFIWLFRLAVPRKRARYVFLLYLALVPGYLGWLFQFIDQVFYGNFHSWINLPREDALLGLLYWAFSSIRPDALSLLGILLAAIALAFYLSDLRKPSSSDLKKKPLIEGELVAAVAVLFPAITLLAISFAIKPLWVNRYLLFVLPAIYLLAARGTRIVVLQVSRISKIKIGPQMGLLIILPFLLNTAFDARYHYPFTKGQQAREVSERVVSLEGRFPKSYSLVCGSQQVYDYYESLLDAPDLFDDRDCQYQHAGAVYDTVTTSGLDHLIIAGNNNNLDQEMLAIYQEIFCLEQVYTFGRGGSVRLYSVPSFGENGCTLSADP